jgi:ribonuclease-3
MESVFVQQLKETYGIQFKNEALLENAFTHSSYVNEHKFLELKDNERLEFLGDAVLEYVISEYLYRNYPDYSEGKLSKLRSSIVREESLSTFALECNFDRYIHLGKGEEATGGRTRPSLLCDLFESFLGAVTLDQGLETTQKFIYQVMIPKVQTGIFEEEMDFKTRLQEVLQKNGDIKIEYHLSAEEGLAHERIFTMDVYAGGEKIGSGDGTSKKNAEQQAASNALDLLEE